MSFYYEKYQNLRINLKLKQIVYYEIAYLILISRRYKDFYFIFRIKIFWLG